MVCLPPKLSSLLFLLQVFLVSSIVTSAFHSSPKPDSECLIRAQSLVNDVNSRQNKWTAKLNPRFAEMTIEQMKTQLLGLKKDPEEHKKFLEQRRKRKNKMISLNGNRRTTMASTTYQPPSASSTTRGGAQTTEPSPIIRSSTAVPMPPKIPDYFDAREQWPMCRDVIAQIQDQSRCIGSWAISTASVIQDRICIATNGKTKVSISAHDLISCDTASNGCHGGYANRAFEYWQKNGICTGSNYTLQSGCKPYPYPPHLGTNDGNGARKCQKQCTNNNYEIHYRRDKHYAKSYTNIVDADEADIQKAIMAGGPVEADMLVFKDFIHYSYGVYRRTTDALLGGHAVRIVGWGLEDDEENTPYWLVANSWNADWGEDGYFRIARDEDECWIESWGTNYGEPNLWI